MPKAEHVQKQSKIKTILASPYQLSPQFAAITPFFNSMAGFLISFAIIRHDVRVPCRLVVTRMASSLAGEKRSVLSILCVAQFHTEALRSAVLTFVLVQDGNKSVLFSSFLRGSGGRTVIATVSSRTYRDWLGIFSFHPWHFAIIGPNSSFHGYFL
jgi:hypothetical protein